MSKRALRKEEVEKVITQLMEIRKSTYTSKGPKKEEIEQILEPLNEANWVRNQVSDKAILKYEHFELPATEIDEAKAKEIAEQIKAMKPKEKWERIAELSTEDRDKGKEKMFKDVKGAEKERDRIRASVVEQANLLLEASERDIESAEDAIEMQKHIIEDLEKDLKESKEHRNRLRELREEEEETIYSDGSRKEKKKHSIDQAEIDGVKKEIKSLEKSLKEARDELSVKKVALYNAKKQRDDLKGEIDRLLAENKLSLDWKPKSKSDDVEIRDTASEKTDDVGGSYTGQTRRGIRSILPEPSEETLRRRATRDKASNIIYGFNESLTQDQILDHIRNGRLDYMIEAKRKLRRTEDVKDFDEELSQIIDKIIADGNLILDSDDNLLLSDGTKIGMRDVKTDIPVLSKIPRLGEKIKRNDKRQKLTFDEIQSLSKELEILLDKRPEDLTDEEMARKDVLQILILQGVNRQLRLPFGIGRRIRLARENAGMEIGRLARTKISKRQRDRRFLDSILVEIGEDPMGDTREDDPVDIRGIQNGRNDKINELD